ncbi:hypothetical protein HN51_061949 [Arachis hypogaea]
MANLKFEDLYIVVLIVYNDINKHLPGPHFDLPPKDKVREMMKRYTHYYERWASNQSSRQKALADLHQMQTVHSIDYFRVKSLFKIEALKLLL